MNEETRRLNYINNRLESLNREMAELSKEKDSIKGKCEHQFLDGKSSWVSGYFATHCDVCGWSDMGY